MVEGHRGSHDQASLCIVSVLVPSPNSIETVTESSDDIVIENHIAN